MRGGGGGGGIGISEIPPESDQPTHPKKKKLERVLSLFWLLAEETKESHKLFQHNWLVRVSTYNSPTSSRYLRQHKFDYSKVFLIY